MHPAVAEQLRLSGGVIARRDYPEWGIRLDHARRRSELITLLPGVYATPPAAQDWRSRARAVALWDTDAVVFGDTVAALTFRTELCPRVVQAASRKVLSGYPGFSFHRRHIPVEHIVDLAGIRMTEPALAAIDMVDQYGGDAIDWALQARATTLARMYQALDATPHRRGNRERRRMLLDSRSEPWSAAERLAHRILRTAGITQWDSNVRISCDGQTYYLDIAMRDCPIVIEIDGRIAHGVDRFEWDRRRGNLLLLHGKQVLHFTWRMLTDEPEWVIETIRRARAMWGC